MAPSRGIAVFGRFPNRSHVCRICQQRSFASATSLQSGHNRWSKIKHDKGKNDAAKNRQRSIFAREITLASKLFGPEPNSNPRLADLITKARKEGFAKTSIEAAIARGQGRSPSGASLESITVEGLLPYNVAVIVECETDNKSRTLMDVRLVMKEAGGSATPSAYLFQKKGRITFEKKCGLGVEEAMDSALEAGATDVDEDEDGTLVVSSEPGDIRAVTEAVAQALNLQVTTSEILWEPNEGTKVTIPNELVAQELCNFVDGLQERESSIQAVAMNVAQGRLENETWKELVSRLNI